MLRMHTTELISMTKKELLNISGWSRVNKPNASLQKTEFMVIGHQCRINEITDFPPLKLNDSRIKRVRKVKSLGVTVDEGLVWKNKFKSLTGKLAGGLSSLKRCVRLFFPIQNYVMFIVLCLRLTYATET